MKIVVTSGSFEGDYKDFSMNEMDMGALILEMVVCG